MKIGGIDQWVQIRGESSTNPVLLVLHGGPGASFIPYTRLFREWERHFTVVLWDQRGTGQTYTRNTLPDSRTMTIDRMTADGLEITAYLRARLHQDRIMLLAHSWGSVLGVGMVTTRPGWYSAFVGTGFIVSELPDWIAAFDILLANVRAAGDETALRALTAIGPPPYVDSHAQKIHDRWIHRYDTLEEKNLSSLARMLAFTHPRYSLTDIHNFYESAEFSEQTIRDELYAYDARTRPMQFDVPIVIVEGTEDMVTPAAYIRRYFDDIRAPAKSFALVRGGGHSVIVTRPAEFLDSMLAALKLVRVPLWQAPTSRPH